MTDTIQKLREALSELIEAYNRAGPELSRAERAVDRMRLVAAHEALALQTADHIPEAGEMVADHLPDAGKMINGLTQAETDASASVSGLTAALVGDREAFGYFYIVNGVHEGFCKGGEPPPDDSYDEGTLVPVYRSALSAGDAVDAQRYRWLTDGKRGDWVWNHVLTEEVKGEHSYIECAIDAAIRKGQL